MANSVAFSDKAKYCNSTYNIKLGIHVLNPGETSTDHAPFWNSNFTAIGIGEEHHVDFYPYWHTQADSLAQFNLSFFQKCAKLAYATIADFAVDTVNMVGIDEIDLAAGVRVYPNPFHSSLVIDAVENKSNITAITVSDCLGRVLFKEESGHQTSSIMLSNLQNGVYWLKIITADSILIKKIVKN